jgi:nitrite reductase/ring-hydroxylating ferredoxin subunit
MATYTPLLNVDELPPGQSTERMVNGRPVAIFNVGGRFYATSNFCVHRGGPLGQGQLDGCVVMCPWHAWTFDVTTGESTVNPELKVTTYPVKLEDGRVWVELE